MPAGPKRANRNKSVKGHPRVVPRSGGVGSRHENPTGYVATPGSPSLDDLKRLKKRERGY